MTYVRSQAGLEVDFLARAPARRPELIQVCASLHDPVTREREVRALLAGAAEHPDASLHLVALTTEGAESIPDSIAVHAASRWLLGAER